MEKTFGDGSGVLLLHGFGGAPFEMQGLAEGLHERGAIVETPLLPGHGTSIQDFNSTGFQDWAGAALDVYDSLLHRTGRVAVVGLSMGGTLALHLGAKRPVAALVALAAPVFLYRWWPPLFTDWRLPLVPMLGRIRPLWPVAPPRPESRRIAPWQGYESVVSLSALASFMQGMREVDAQLAQVKAPLLAVHCPTDRTVPLASSRRIMERVSSVDKRLELVAIRERVTSHHLLTTHEETKAQVMQLVVSHLKKVLG